MMLPMDTTHFKESLQSELAQLEAEMATVGRKNPDNPNDWEATPGEHQPESDPTEVADQSEDFQERQAILEDLEVRYSGVKRALSAIEKGTYGTCEICQSPIEEDRLKANAAARTCKAHMEEEGSLGI